MLTKNAPSRPPPVAPVYWLIAKDENVPTEMLTIDRGGGEALPVFSFREEAEMFLALGASGAGWSVRRTSAGELVSIFMGPCASVEFVALDPMPELVCLEMADLVSVSRERFMHRLIQKA